MKREEIQELLDGMNPGSMDYPDWFKAIAAAKTAGASFEQVEDWCRRGRFEHENEVSKRWPGISTDKGAGAGSLVTIARKYGYNGLIGAPGTHYTTFRSNYKERAKKRVIALPEQSDGMGELQADILSKLPPEQQMKEYLSALFKPEEYISIAFDGKYDEEKKKWNPVVDRKLYKVADLIATPPSASAFNAASGGWLRANPILPELISDGNGIADKDVSDFRFVLVESDEMPIPEQIKAYRRMNLPIAALVLSGGKSVHAIIRIEAKDKAEYDHRVRNVLYPFMSKYGFILDDANKNPSRFTRFPGVKRGDNMQTLIGLASGPDSWSDWDYWREEIEMGLPPLDDVFDIVGENRLPLLPEVIEGTLRQRNLMSITGGSKSSKTFLLTELAIAVATGGEWLGRKCTRGKVLYVNLEVDRPLYSNRLDTVLQAMDISPHEIKGWLKVHSLRGHQLTIDDIKRAVDHYAKRMDFSLVILDPLYKILGDRDENSAGDVGDLFNYFDSIAELTGAAFAFAHHHSKGGQSGKSAQDRGSGSGTFARAPDCMLDMLQLEIPEDVKEVIDFDEDETALQYSWVLRGYPPHKPEQGFFRYPLHVMDTEGLLKGARSLIEANASDARRRNAKKPLDWKRLTDSVYNDLLQASLEDGAPYPGQVQVAALVRKLTEKTSAGDDYTRKKIHAAGYKFGRAKGGLPAFVSPETPPTPGVVVPFPDPLD